MVKAPTPRVIFIRHGQTEWSKSGQYTSITDLDLTEFGVKQMTNTGKHLIGKSPFQLIKPENLKHVFTSPRLRAKHTVKLLLENVDDLTRSKIPIQEENDIREWEYGDYEGLLTKDIIKLRESRDLGSDWNIWRDGCENGEVHTQVKERLDKVIGKIRSIHKDALENNEACDIIVVGHGHILRCFAARWVGKEINVNPQFMLDAGGVGVLSYQHHNIEEPALFLAGAFVVPVEEEGGAL
ncbi:sedoheptulose 1,7-bisphosphatase [[Candida] jaroonii]|uniref:Sedoheptulose 1,7-bisphosphatase n=1 Tax=[Candida] jaroonii TaxID=467808 RepID=A0ACA9YAI2_9ASCO|nr:sedoheptulose 1,7-bisphosphatase [[Candida] jaroonii]